MIHPDDDQLYRRVVETLQTKMPEYLEMLRRMVEVNSFTSHANGINRLGDVTSEIFASLNFKAERVPSSQPLHGDHLVLRRAAARVDQSASVAMISHLDTVYSPEEEQENDFCWRPEGNRIYGPGTVDIKGGTLMMYMVLDALQSCTPDAFESVNWIVMLNAAEENLVEEFRQLFIDFMPEDLKAVLVFEGGRQNGNRFHLVTARKGRAAFRITASGRAAHAGSAHEDGANAVVQLAATIGKIDQLTDYGRQITVNVGTISGGTVINRVPHFAEASGEIRTFAPEDLDSSIDRLLSLRDEISVRSRADDYACQIDVDIIGKWQPWPPNAGSKKLYEFWQQAAAVVGSEIFEEERGGLSDGNLLWNLAPTIDGLGPSGGNAHCSERTEDGSKDQEFVRVSSFVPKAALNMLAIHSLINSGKPVEKG